MPGSWGRGAEGRALAGDRWPRGEIHSPPCGPQSCLVLLMHAFSLLDCSVYFSDFFLCGVSCVLWGVSSLPWRCCGWVAAARCQ